MISYQPVSQGELQHVCHITSTLFLGQEPVFYYENSLVF